jgi:hypothetical protein
MAATKHVASTGIVVEGARGAHRVTRHARERMTARRIPAQAIDAALVYGRTVHVRGATIRAIGRREIARCRAQGIDLADYEGVQVVCGHDGTVLTAYRNRDFRRLRPRW